MSQGATNANFKVFSKSYVFDPRPHIPFRVSAKRYWTRTVLDSEKCARANTNPNLDDDGKTRGDALTFIFAHANGFHKEHWEPIIRRLFEQQRVAGGSSFQIQDMWSFDAPNHGDAAVMNEEVFAWGYSVFSWDEYGRSIRAFLTRLGTGVDVDFSKRNLVAVGHSMGAVALMLSTTFFPQIKFSSMHLIEPIIMGEYAQDFGSHLVRGAENRRDIWESTEHAYKSMKNRITWQKWDDRILRIYVEHGLRSLPTAEYPDQKDGVTLKCTRKQEAAVYRDHRAHSAAYRLLPHLLKRIPTHITYGKSADLLPPAWHHDVLNHASGGVGKFASVTLMPDAGHLIVQTHPDVMADVICKSVLQTHLNYQVPDALVTARL